MLFIDSSHVAKIGSDVNYEIHDIVPRLKVGALVHWHDIMIPIDYPKDGLRMAICFGTNPTWFMLLCCIINVLG